MIPANVFAYKVYTYYCENELTPGGIDRILKDCDKIIDKCEAKKAKIKRSIGESGNYTASLSDVLESVTLL